MIRADSMKKVGFQEQGAGTNPPWWIGSGTLLCSLIIPWGIDPCPPAFVESLDQALAFKVTGDGFDRQFLQVFKDVLHMVFTDLVLVQVLP